ncbi:MAG: SET domain-containing protein [bacterium]|nr:SET domain-containing protein [bacterium]
MKTKIGPSKIHGIGLFADELIPNGTILWKYVPGFDLRFTKEEVEKLPEAVQKFIHFYDYESKDTGYLVICADNARFYNHSEDPNTEGIDLPETDGEGGDVAARDIHLGEEITCDYEKMDFAYKQKLL